PGLLRIRAAAYFVWARPPTVGGTVPGHVQVHSHTTASITTSKQLWLKCYRDLGAWRWPSQLQLGEGQAPQVRGVYGLHCHVEYPTMADAVIETLQTPDNHLEGSSSERYSQVA